MIKELPVRVWINPMDYVEQLDSITTPIIARYANKEETNRFILTRIEYPLKVRGFCTNLVLRGELVDSGTNRTHISLEPSEILICAIHEEENRKNPHYEMIKRWRKTGQPVWYRYQDAWRPCPRPYWLPNGKYTFNPNKEPNENKSKLTYLRFETATELTCGSCVDNSEEIKKVENDKRFIGWITRKLK